MVRGRRPALGDLGARLRDRPRHVEELDADFLMGLLMGPLRTVADDGRLHPGMAASTCWVSALRLRFAYSSRNQRPRAVAVTAAQMES